MNEALQLYVEHIRFEDRAKEEDIKDWIDNSEAKFKRPLFYVVVTRDDRVIGILHYTYIKSLGHAFVSYIVAKRGTPAFSHLLRYLTDHLTTLGGSGVVAEVDRLEPGHSDGEFEKRRQRLRVFQHHGGRVLHGVSYAQPDLQNRSTPKLMHLMYFSLTGREALPSTEVRRLLKFIYHDWYGDPYRGDKAMTKYLRRLSLRRFWIPLFSVSLEEPITQAMTLMPKPFWRDLVVPAVAAAVAGVYAIPPLQEVIDGWISAGVGLMGGAVAVFALVVLGTVAHVFLTKDTPV
jgi:hypothetical protein